MKKLQKGDSGPEVSECQRLLSTHGYPVASDGVFGPKTEQEVKAFQYDKGLTVDGIVGAQTWSELEETPGPQVGAITMEDLAAHFPAMLSQTYSLHDAQCPSNPPGLQLRNIGASTTNCVQFLGWLLPVAFNKAYPSIRFSGDQWKHWMVAASPTDTVPNWSPRVLLEWGVGTTAPGPGPWLVQMFSIGNAGHNVLVLAHDAETDKILTLEATNVAKLDGAGFYEIGNLRDIINPGPDWPSKVTQTWQSRFGSMQAIHVCRVSITGVEAWLNVPT
tara:strand:- start:80 stop:904 length:825 start_codon:yes stop_codon:yes gene_type:complete